MSDGRGQPVSDRDQRVARAAERIRIILLALDGGEDRTAAMYATNICDGCGRDLRRLFRDPDVCHCENDE